MKQSMAEITGQRSRWTWHRTVGVYLSGRNICCVLQQMLTKHTRNGSTLQAECQAFCHKLCGHLRCHSPLRADNVCFIKSSGEGFESNHAELSTLHFETDTAMLQYRNRTINFQHCLDFKLCGPVWRQVTTKVDATQWVAP